MLNKALSNCHREQRLAAAYVKAHSGAYNDRQIQLWIHDWIIEECLILKEMSMLEEIKNAVVEEVKPLPLANRKNKDDEVAPPVMFLQACGSRVIVEEDPFKETSRIIVTPDNQKRRPTTGRIVNLGDDVMDAYELGDRVLFGQFSGTLIHFKGRPAYRVLSTDEILAKILVDDETLELIAV